MCSLKAAQVHERPFRTAKDHVQPKGKKISDFIVISSLQAGQQVSAVSEWVSLRTEQFSQARAYLYRPPQLPGYRLPMMMRMMK